MSKKGTDRMIRALRDLTRQFQPFSVIGTVVSVSSETCTVNPIDGTAEYTDIKLKPDTTEAGIFLVPKVGSVVMVSLINETDGYISMFSECDSVKIMDGSNGGVPITSDIVTQLNTIEQDLNDLKTAFGSWTPIPNDGGAALKAALASYISATITNTQDSDIENTSFTHGI